MQVRPIPQVRYSAVIAIVWRRAAAIVGDTGYETTFRNQRYRLEIFAAPGYCEPAARVYREDAGRWVLIGTEMWRSLPLDVVKRWANRVVSGL